jgi:hypothetical protein
MDERKAQIPMGLKVLKIMLVVSQPDAKMAVITNVLPARSTYCGTLKNVTFRVITRETANLDRRTSTYVVSAACWVLS